MADTAAIENRLFPCKNIVLGIFHDFLDTKSD